ncbi:MAG: DUF3667 domain-containing protein [Pseudomonadales bacterium]|nr:DUF3667 domain-containing protein [Pseudomonadales bacterium]
MSDASLPSELPNDSAQSTAVDLRRCKNCSQPLEAEFCGFCGQQEKEVRRPVIYFLQELLRVVFELDGRAYKTVFTLLTRPGFLTREYFAGRRVKYTPPLRLFLVVSIGFFLIVSIANTLQSMQMAVEEAAAVEAVVEESNQETIEGDPETEMTDEEFEESFGDAIDFIATVEMPFFSPETNSALQVAVSTQLRTNLREAVADPREFFSGSLEYITFFILLMMPILALIQQIFWIMSRRFFVEHLVLCVHNHTFIILMIFVSMVLGLIDDLAVPVLSTVADIMGGIAVLWIMIYLFLSLKRYFETHWFVTLVLFSMTSLAYTVVLSMGLLGFLLLLVLFA